MKKVCLLLFALSECFFSCHQMPTENKTEVTPQKDASQHKIDTFVISHEGMLFLRPNKAKMETAVEKIKKELGEDALLEIASDEGLYTGQASEFGQKKGLAQFNSTANVILFIKENGHRIYIENKIEGIGSEIYLFDTKQDPKKVENVPSFPDGIEYSQYFGK